MARDNARKYKSKRSFTKKFVKVLQMQQKSYPHKLASYPHSYPHIHITI